MRKVLLIGLTPPLEGGSQQQIFEIVKKIDKKKFDITVLTQKGTLCKRYVKYIEIDIKSKQGYSQSLEFYKGVKKLIPKLGKFDVVHLHENYLCFLIKKLKKQLRSKILLTAHGLKGFKYFDNKVLWHFFKKRMQKADLLIAVSKPDESILKSYFKKVLLIHNGVDLKLYENIHPKIEKKVVFIGRLHKQKGIAYLLEAFNKVSKDHKGFILEIIGAENEYSDILKKQFKSNHINWLGYLGDRGEIVKRLKSAYCIALPSLWEGSPLTLFEALASARPLIISDIPPFKSVIRDEALFFKSKNANDLADKLSMLLNDGKLADKLGQKSLRLAKSYSWEKIVKRLQKVY